MNVELLFSYDFSEVSFNYVINEIIEFSKTVLPKEIIIDESYDYEDGLLEINNLSLENFITMMLLSEKCSIHLIKNNHINKVLIYNIIYKDAQSFQDTKYSHLLNHKSFIYGNIINEIDSRYQSMDNVNDLKREGIFDESMKTFKDKFGLFDVIDISKNYGRSIFSSGILFCAGHKQWFSPKTFELFPKKKLLTFKAAHEVKELDNGVIEMTLYPDLFQPIDDKTRAKKKF